MGSLSSLPGTGLVEIQAPETRHPFGLSLDREAPVFGTYLYKKTLTLRCAQHGLCGKNCSLFNSAGNVRNNILICLVDRINEYIKSHIVLVDGCVLLVKRFFDKVE